MWKTLLVAWALPEGFNQLMADWWYARQIKETNRSLKKRKSSRVGEETKTWSGKQENASQLIFRHWWPRLVEVNGKAIKRRQIDWTLMVKSRERNGLETLTRKEVALFFGFVYSSSLSKKEASERWARNRHVQTGRGSNDNCPVKCECECKLSGKTWSSFWRKKSKNKATSVFWLKNRKKREVNGSTSRD